MQPLIFLWQYAVFYREIVWIVYIGGGGQRLNR